MQKIYALIAVSSLGCLLVSAQTDLALGRNTTSSALWPATEAGWAVDGDLATNFTSSADFADPYLQIDLESPRTLGRVEIVSRQDGDQPTMRCNFSILGSNNADFSAAKVLAVQGAAVMGVSTSTWTSPVDSAIAWRYVRVQRTQHAGHFVFAEIRVFGPDAGVPSSLSYKVPEGNVDLLVGDKLLLSKASGKVLGLAVGEASVGSKVATQTFTFILGQRWRISAGGGSIADGFSLEALGSGLALDGSAIGQPVALVGGGLASHRVWKLDSLGAGFVQLKHTSSGGCLDGSSAQAGLVACADSPNQIWNIVDAWERPPVSSTDWMNDGRYGVMIHFLPTDAATLATSQDLDVEALAAQLEDAGAAWLLIALGQNSGYYNVPSLTYEAFAGQAHGSKWSDSDLMMRLAPALHKRGIRLLLYLPCQPANADEQAQKGFGLTPGGGTDRPVNMDFVQRWAVVLQELSDRYGKLVDGWWFDGGYANIGFRDEMFDVYASALKHGNHNSVVTFNPGVGLMRYSSAEDFTAGEINDPFSIVPTSRFIDGDQWHELTHLSEQWAGRTPRYTPQQWITQMGKVFDQGGVINIDVGPNWDKKVGPIGSISESMMVYFRQFRTAFPRVNTANLWNSRPIPPRSKRALIFGPDKLLLLDGLGRPTKITRGVFLLPQPLP